MRRGAETASVQLQLAGLWHVGMGRTACGPTDHNTSTLGVEARGVALCERRWSPPEPGDLVTSDRSWGQ